MKPTYQKYQSFEPIGLYDRQWPDAVLNRAPIWLSTDLRDGNQALFEPMDHQRKLQLFKMLCQIGFKEIEVGFPSASQIEYDFVRLLIEQNQIPDDVTIGVLTQAREPLIKRTMQALLGAPRAIVHVYNATSPRFRDVVFSMNKQQVIDTAVNSVELIKNLAGQQQQTHWLLEYSPETFSATELDFAKDICDAVVDTWQASTQRKVIINLPATVEMSTPNHYADQIEWMHRNLAHRDSIVLSVHPHNDRGSAIAAAELAMMAGAERVEGCLFGNGERTGNVDLVTLALNLYSQGIDPHLDFSDISKVARKVEYCTQLPIHPRHPYVGDLVFTAFSGSHQDAIKKGFAAQKDNEIWQVPYLPIDPADVGRSYESIVRVNSQSGKGGIAFLLENHYGLIMPRRLQVEFSGVVQKHLDQCDGVIKHQQLWAMFEQTYLEIHSPIKYISHRLVDRGSSQGISINYEVNGQEITVVGEGNGPLDAAIHALALPVQIHSYEERSMGYESSSKAMAFVEIQQMDQQNVKFGVGIDHHIVTASIKAIFSAINRLGMDVVGRELKQIIVN